MLDAVIIEVAILILKNTSSVRVKRLGLISSVFITCDVKFSLEDDLGTRLHENTYNLCSTVSTCSTSKVTWSEEMNFGDTQTHAVLDLDGLKRFCLRGLDLRIVEEKVQRHFEEVNPEFDL